MCGCAGAQVCRCAGGQVCKCAGVRVCGCAGVQVCGFAGVRVSRCAIPHCVEVLPTLPAVSTLVLWYYEVIPQH